MSEPNNINKEVQDFNSLQKASHYRLTWDIFKTVKSLPKCFWIMGIMLCVSIGVTLTLYYEMKEMTLATTAKTESNRQQAGKFFRIRKENQDALYDQIDKLNLQIEDEKKQKYVLRQSLIKSENLSAKHAETLSTIKTTDLASQMLNEAYQTIAMNAVPLNLQQYIGVASDEQWTGYAQMASDRNAYNVIGTIASIPELMKIKKVASIVNSYKQAMDMAKVLKAKGTLK
jgi:hypothetical protein